QPPGTACPEPAEVDPSRDYQLVVEQRRDQEAAEDEEYIDADKATRQERDTGVSGEHRQDGKSTDTVERADATIQSHQSARLTWGCRAAFQLRHPSGVYSRFLRHGNPHTPDLYRIGSSRVVDSGSA